ncbi:hypothetical protein JCM10599A_64310 [Paraburkholderia kururiensis]
MGAAEGGAAAAVVAGDELLVHGDWLEWLPAIIHTVFQNRKVGVNSRLAPFKLDMEATGESEGIPV